MSAVESALEVLSRAATMVQEIMKVSRGVNGSLWQPWLQSFEAFCASSDARSRAAEERPTKNTTLHRKPSSAWRKERRRDPLQCEALDMSATRVHSSRPSVIVPPVPQPGATTENTAVTPTGSATPAVALRGQLRPGIRHGGPVSDPAIDEHFKRSLGPKDYAAIFNSTNDKEAGLSVDDHFAKALGETWTRLQQATNRAKNVKKESKT